MKIKVINLKYFCIFFLIALLQERLFFQTNISLVFIISIFIALNRTKKQTGGKINE